MRGRALRRPARRRRVLAGVAAATSMLAAACGSAVEVTAAADAASPACVAASARWPQTVGNTAVRDTSSTSASVRAWGDPPIIARCGLPPIGPTTDVCVTVSGIDWVAHQLTDGVRFTTYGRSPAIEVLVPKDYQPEPLLLPAFAAAATAIPQGERRCR